MPEKNMENSPKEAGADGGIDLSALTEILRRADHTFGASACPLELASLVWVMRKELRHVVETLEGGAARRP
ncbi:hypothetical protein C5F59_038465 [Streptomyces sp. QL37]|uniref:hypothetical protein n=1 Tax=Streptomyces sp. QL37 TaxID=2093747 RepID=UPI000CF2E6DE|nr:hypothetical protein [Streptomyces sp. QL37]PPQ61979.1 hypothetical protein C5F59_39005 [Streptomyces sp. QL37]